MIIYNQDRIGIKYLTSDNIIFEINSTKKLEELLQMLLDGEDISTVAAINGVIVDGDGTIPHITYQVHQTPSQISESIDIPNYFLIHDEDYDDDYDSFIPDAGAKPFMQEKEDYLHNQYEKRLMGARDARLEFKPFPINTSENQQVFKEQLAYTVGIMPTLLNAEEAEGKTVSELKKLSASADIAYNHGVADYYANDYPALLPDYKTAEMLAKLSNSERELITDGFLDPMLLTDFIARKKAALGKNILLTEDDILFMSQESNSSGNNYIYSEYPDSYVINLNCCWNSNVPLVKKNIYQDLVEEATKLFDEQFHFVPRVLDDYCKAYLESIPTKDEYKVKKLAKDLVENFSRTSLSKVASTKNKVLYVLSSKLNFAEVREDHMLAMGTFYSEKVLARLDENNFVNYYKAYNDMSLGDLTKLLRLYRSHTNLIFDVDKTPKELIARMENERGVRDCESMESRYDYKFAENDIAIRGRNIMAVDGQMKMYMLPPDDYRNFTTGYDTNCCQHYGSAGESCVWKLTSDPFAANVVIERNGKILAQGFVWTDESKDTLVFDNVEFADDRTVQQFNDLFAVWSSAMPYKNIHVGVGYNQGMQSWGKRINSVDRAIMPTTLSNRHVYSDYNGNARTLKDNGIMKISPNKAVRVVQQELIPSKYDELNRLGLTYLISTGFGVDKLIEIAGKMQNDTLSEEEYMDLFRACPNKEDLLNNMPHIPDRVQLWLADTASYYIDKIQNPCEQILVRQIEQNPIKIRFMDNPSEEMQLAVVRANGMFLGEINNPTDRVIEEAVRANGVAITMVPPERQTDTLKLLAIESWAKVIASIDAPTEEMINAALDREPTAVSLIRGEIPLNCQLRLVENHPSAINDIPSPHPSVIRRAIEKDGMLIRNYQNRFPELRMIAINQNPFAIGTLNRPTETEVLTAIMANPRVASVVKDKDVLTHVQANLTETQTEINQENDLEMAG